MKTVKLNTHQKNFSSDDIVIYQKDFPNAKVGDVVEIYSPDDCYSRLLLQITNLSDKYKKDAISIESSIASTFQLRNFSDVVVNIVNPNDVVLDSVELFFKDQYLARSDMWLLKKSIKNTCVYLNKKVEFSSTKACQVFEMWSHGDRMASGYINEETRVVYRSASSMVYLFLQMSSEMWDYDINGDLYFEKAVNGFLNDLFNKWKTFNCCHDVTIVFFSRTYYDAADIKEFPVSMRECLQKDSKGRYYEDYYRVAVQNERYDDWTPMLIYLKKLFNLYEKEVIHYHEKRAKNNEKVPKGYNSNASQGNFLEVLNMSLNVFERHNLDRSFDRTGQLSVVISPGVGVYEVDLDLTNITKQRIIDNGIGSDLVCLGEQPLHAVPLFKFNSGPPNMHNDEYNMPHWINLSFYSSKQRFSSNFIPRIKMPNISQTKSSLPKRTSLNFPSFYNFDILAAPGTIDLKSYQHLPTFIDFDEYDNQIFKTNFSDLNNHSMQPSQIKMNANLLESVAFDMAPNFNLLRPTNETVPRRRLSEVVPYSGDTRHMTPPNSPAGGDMVDGLYLLYERQPSHAQLSTSVENKGLNDIKFKHASKDDITMLSNKNEPHRTKALINPFDPTNVTIKLNSNRRRWTHVFPIGRTGIFMQQHHYQAVPQSANYQTESPPNESSELPITNKRLSFDQVDSGKLEEPFYRWNARSRSSMDVPNKKNSFDPLLTDPHQKGARSLLTDNSSLWAWGATGELEWSHAITTGVDWKSLVIPACLPVTTDFLPDRRTLQQDYVTYAYDLLPEEQQNDSQQQRFAKTDEDCKKKIGLTTDRVFMELICQRLQQGFQLILQPKNQQYIFSTDKDGRNLHILSIGRIYHELSLRDGKITITYYHPRHPYNAKNIQYCYRIRTPDNETYGVSWVEFAGEKLENYKWNYLDNLICTYHGESDYQLIENLKFWRFRLLVLPSMQAITRQIISKYNDGENDFQCDLYHSFSIEEKLELQAGFLKLIETINGIKRPALKQPNTRIELNKTLNRRYSSAAINSQVSATNSDNFLNRHSQPSDTILSTINETQSRCELINFKQDESKKMYGDTPEKGDNAPHRLSASSLHSEIIEFMTNSNLFFIKGDDLPVFTFISSDAIDWAMKNVEQVDNETKAEVFFESLLSTNHIRHASGDVDKSFKRGFYLYCIMCQKNIEYFEKQRYEFKPSFERDWMEVGVVHQHNWKNFDIFYQESSDFMSHNLKMDNSEFTFKNMMLDLENSNKSGRIEWVNVKYHSLYDPDQAFEMIIEWMVATGNAIPEIISRDWGRTKNTGLHIVPIPWDPFALPFSSKSDPLRGPIYISLNVDYLCQLCDNKMIEGERLFSFQEKILFKFGFIPFCDPSTDNQRNFVHVSGSIFVMVPSKNTTSTASKNSNKRGKFLIPSEHEQPWPGSPIEGYITRHFSGMQQKGQDVHIDTKIGFLWCWNYMITKRWKTNVTGDEYSMRKIMQDFRAFCSNHNDRLKHFWETFNRSSEPNDDLTH